MGLLRNFVAAGIVVVAFSHTAWADGPDPTYQPATAPALAPSPSDSRAAMRSIPSDCTTCPKCAPCGREPCYQKRDACGWPTDQCGKRIGCLDVALEGSYSFLSNPDGLLGELVAGNTAPLNWNDLDYGGEFGGRVTIGYRYEPFRRIEVRGAYYGNPTDSRSVSGFFGATPGITGTGDLSRPVDAAFSTDATTWGVELNWWNELSCDGAIRTEWGLGARYVSFDETAHVGFVATGPGPFPVANGFVDSDTTNDWYGIQGCFAVHYDVTASLDLGFTVKALLGQVRSETHVSDDSIFAGGAHSASAKDEQIGIGADIDLSARWRVTSRISVIGALNVLWLDKVQRAEDALDFSHSATGAVQARNAPDQLLMESLYLGVAFTF